jgi:hypothetical protein
MSRYIAEKNAFRKIKMTSNLKKQREYVVHAQTYHGLLLLA